MGGCLSKRKEIVPCLNNDVKNMDWAAIEARVTSSEFNAAACFFQLPKEKRSTAEPITDFEGNSSFLMLLSMIPERDKTDKSEGKALRFAKIVYEIVSANQFTTDNLEKLSREHSFMSKNYPVHHAFRLPMPENLEMVRTIAKKYPGALKKKGLDYDTFIDITLHEEDSWLTPYDFVLQFGFRYNDVECLGPLLEALDFDGNPLKGKLPETGESEAYMMAHMKTAGAFCQGL
ncbi:hypothetical protein ScalyP_jg10539 [Parmales sp. scaly parma]|nr:hypothetical protein ScalyP_jg10539 [Parmales sp. scaly parma]